MHHALKELSKDYSKNFTHVPTTSQSEEQESFLTGNATIKLTNEKMNCKAPRAIQQAPLILYLLNEDTPEW